MTSRRSAGIAAMLLAASIGIHACEERAPDYEDAGERLDAAIDRVEELKIELREAEEELRTARAAIERKVDSAPSGAAGVPTPPPE